MPLIHSLLKVVKEAWHRRRGGPRSRKHAGLALEHLDHRQLLSVTFTGNATTDIPSTIGPGFAVVQNTTRVTIDPTLAPLIKVSGFDVNAIRMFYSASDDTLNIAIEQPLNQKTSPLYPVIAGDADNNLNGGTVSPAVLALQPLFQDFPSLGGSEYMFVSLCLKNSAVPDVVAGITNQPDASKLYQVATAVNFSSGAPGFGTTLSNNTGQAFLNDTDPAHGAFEFQITNFSKLYQQITGKALTAATEIGVGGYAGSATDFSGELFIAPQAVNLGVNPVPDCPPLSPPVIIAPHQNRHVNIAHASYVRVNIFGTSGFDVTKIASDTVKFGGASPVSHFTRHINGDHFMDATYIFRSDQLNLPPGIQYAAVSGQYNDPVSGKQVPFSSSNQIYVKDYSSYSPSQIAAQQARLAKTGDPIPQTPQFIQQRANRAGVVIVPNTAVATSATTNASVAPTVKLALRAQKASNATVAPNVVINRAPGFRQTGLNSQGAQSKGTQSIRIDAASTTTSTPHVQTSAARQAARMQIHDLAIAALGSA